METETDSSVVIHNASFECNHKGHNKAHHRRVLTKQVSKYQQDLVVAKDKLDQEKMVRKLQLDRNYLADLRRSPIQRIN